MTLDLDEMLGLLSFYLEDTKKRVYPPAVLRSWLNIAQDTAVLLLNPNQTSELIVHVNDAFLYGDGSFDLSSLTVAPSSLANSILRVRNKDDKFYSKISLFEWAKLKDKSHVFTTDKPKFYPVGTKIMCEPFSADDVATGSIVEDVVYVNYGYTTVTYDGNDYADGESFTGVDDATYTTSGSGSVIAAQELELWYNRRAAQMAIETADVPTGGIRTGVVYINSGYTTVTYNEVEYADGEPFVGVVSVTAYTTTGSGSVYKANQDYANVDCEFDSVDIKGIIVKLAASVGYGTKKDGKLLSREYYQKAVNDIENLGVLSSGTDSGTPWGDSDQADDVDIVGDIRYTLAD